jgi:hypothetical protein
MTNLRKIIMTSGGASAVIIGSLLMTSAVSAAGRCKIEMLTPKLSTLVAGPYTLDLGEADDRDRPTAWQGPVTMGQCSFAQFGIVVSPLAIGASRYLFVWSYSGSNDTVAIADLKACAVLWTSKPFAGKWFVNASALVLAGKPMPLGDNCLPIEASAK